jgi:hypothetical protein
MTVNNVVFWDMTSCSLIDRSKLFFVFRVENSHFEKIILSIGVTCGTAKGNKSPPMFLISEIFWAGGCYGFVKGKETWSEECGKGVYVY